MFKIKKIYLLSSWTIFVFILIAWPMRDFDGTVITFYDKFVHAILFGVFYYFLFLFLKEKGTLSQSKIYLLSFFSAVLYSLFSEFLQKYIPGRTVSEYDFIAGVAGIFLALIVTYVQFKKYEMPRG